MHTHMASVVCINTEESIALASGTHFAMPVVRSFHVLPGLSADL